MTNQEFDLALNEEGNIQIGNVIITPGTIIELRMNEEWIQVCIEEQYGNPYCIPMIDLKVGIKCRIINDL